MSNDIEVSVSIPCSAALIKLYIALEDFFIFSSTVSWAELFPDFCIPMCEVFSMTGICVTEYGTALTNILPILFLYLNTVTVTAGTFEP